MEWNEEARLLALTRRFDLVFLADAVLHVVPHEPGENGMMTSDGSGMAALSIAMRSTIPAYPRVSIVARTNPERTARIFVTIEAGFCQAQEVRSKRRGTEGPAAAA